MSEVAKLKKALDFLCSHMPGASELAEIAQKGSLVMDSSHADAEEVFTDEAALPDTLMARYESWHETHALLFRRF